MKKDHLALYLLNQNPVPEELKDGQTRKSLMAFINERIYRTEYHKNAIIHSAGEICDRISFVESGLLRGYKYDKVNDKDKTRYFWDGHTLATDAKSFLQRKPSEISIQVLCPTVVQSITYAQLEEICLAFPFIRGFMTSLLDHDEKYGNKKYHDAGLRADEILSELRFAYSGLELYASKEMIASYIGISRQHLGRIIRNNIRRK